MEIEVKVPVPALEPVRSRARALGYVLGVERHLEANLLLDYPDRSLGAAGCLLRVRETPRGGLLTFKGRPVSHDTYKVRPEHETWCEDAAAVRAVLHAIGLRPVFRYEKYREQYEAPGAHLCLDELPFGVFLELEGSPEGIEALAAALELDRAAFTKRSYADLYAEHCRALGRPFGDILFERGTDGNP